VDFPWGCFPGRFLSVRVRRIGSVNQAPSVEAPAPELTPVLAALAGVRAGLDAAAGEGLWRAVDADLLAALWEHTVLTARLAELGVRLVAEVDSRGIASKAGGSSTRALLVEVLHLAPSVAYRMLGLAKALPTGPHAPDDAADADAAADADIDPDVDPAGGGVLFAATRAALAAGVIGVEAAGEVRA